MKAKEIKEGGIYQAKVSGKLTEVRVDKIRTRNGYGSIKDRTVYDVTNLRTKRTTTFESATKFRGVVNPDQPARRPAKVKGPCPDSPNGQHQFSADLEYDSTGQTINCEHCGALSEPSHLMIDKSEGEQGSDPTLDQPSGEVIQVDSHSAKDVTKVPASVSLTTATAIPSSLASRLANVRSTSGGLTPTAEQEEILAAVQRDIPVVVVEAGAGTGKTSTLKMIGQTLTGNGQYTAFNSSLVTESKTKFAGSSVACNTTHSLAFRAVGVNYSHRLGGDRVRGDQVAEMLGIKALNVPFGSVEKRLSPGFLASQVMGAIRRFCQSADREVGESHFKYIDGIDMPSTDGRRSYASNGIVREYLLPFACKAWADLSNPNGTLPFSHDVYVKIWSLNNPVIAADYILLDEAQDTSACMASVIKQQKCKVILVGDSAQQIYEWRGAVNAMADFPDAPRCLLSQSFRFGQAIADVANAVLNELEEPTRLRLKGFDKIDSKIGSVEKPTAVLCRTNAVAVASLLGAIADGRRPFLIGGSKDTIAFIEASQKLMNGENTGHPDLACFGSWGEVQEYTKQEEGEDLKLMVKIIDEFKPQVLLDALRSMPAKEEDADLVVSTAHKSKGREWDRVKLAADFPTKSKCCDADRKLLYVAVTRAKLVLDVSACPFFTGQDSLDVRSIRDRYHASTPGKIGEEGIVPPTPSVPPPTQFTWSNKDGKWYVRGPKDHLNKTVSIVRKDGSSQQKRLVAIVQEFDSATLYRV